MAVAAIVESGLLKVTGDSEGAVEIVSKANNQLEITDNGVSIGTFDGVKSISINLDASGNANNQVTLKLDATSIDRVMTNLGGGDNSFILASGSIKGSLSYKGGSGKDNLELAVGTSVGRNVYASLGNGLNTLKDGAAITGSLIASGGVDDDTVTILAEATIGKQVDIALGNGANSLTLSGSVEKSLRVKTGSGNDTVAIENSGYVGGSLTANLGAGDNSLSHSGEIAGDLRVTSGTATDKVTIAPESIVGGKTIQRLGVGRNGGGHRGEGFDSNQGPKFTSNAGVRGRR